MNMTAGTPPAEHRAEKSARGTKLLRLIGVFKVIKGVLLLVAAVWALRLRHEDAANWALEWARRLHIAPGNRILQDCLVKIEALSAKRLEVLAGILCIYSAMFLTEGIGLLCAAYWAEWMVVITTSGLIPLEVYELVHKPEIWKVLMLLINILVAIYLSVRVKRDMAEHRDQVQ
jgi:uncharacterized membrane protein (DUF2068 family)